MLITALSTTRNTFLTEHLSLATFAPWILQSLRNSFFIEHFEKQLFADAIQNSCSETFRKLLRKVLALESLFKKTHKKRLQHRCFPVKFAKFLWTSFLIEPLRSLLAHLRWLLQYFFKKGTIRQLFHNLAMTY